MRFSSWPVAAIGVGSLLLLIAVSMLAASRKAQEREYLAEIERRFNSLPRLLVTQLARDVYGLAALGEISAQLSAPLA